MYLSCTKACRLRKLCLSCMGLDKDILHMKIIDNEIYKLIVLSFVIYSH